MDLTFIFKSDSESFYGIPYQFLGAFIPIMIFVVGYFFQQRNHRKELFRKQNEIIRTERRTGSIILDAIDKLPGLLELHKESILGVRNDIANDRSIASSKFSSLASYPISSLTYVEFCNCLAHHYVGQEGNRNNTTHSLWSLIHEISDAPETVHNNISEFVRNVNGEREKQQKYYAKFKRKYYKSVVSDLKGSGKRSLVELQEVLKLIDANKLNLDAAESMRANLTIPILKLTFDEKVNPGYIVLISTIDILDIVCKNIEEAKRFYILLMTSDEKNIDKIIKTLNQFRSLFNNKRPSGYHPYPLCYKPPIDH